MRTLAFFVACIWSVRILKNILSYVHLWYVKEYRPDRMFIHLKTKQGRMVYFLPSKKPPITPKTIFLVVFLIISACVFLLISPFSLLVTMFCIDVCTFPTSFLFVFLLSVPTKIYHMYQIKKAVQMLRNHAPMIVIGVTGSFGKTSTKEFLASILSRKYRVLKTEASKNSPIGIAELVIKHLKPSHQIFIVEMGAYKRGEIKKMSDMVSPEIGIVTGINAQHQDLFKSLDTTMKAKYELIQGLSGKKIGIFACDNLMVKTMVGWAKNDGINVWAIREHSINRPKNEKTFVISHSTSTINSASFTLTVDKKTYHIVVRVRGQHFIGNIALAIAGAISAGMTVREAVKAANTEIEPLTGVMELLKGKAGQHFINDTFNNNPDAAIAALKYLEKFPGKKILVFQPMIELGSYTTEGHEQVGEVAASICDEIILTNANFSEGFISGMKKTNSKKIVRILSVNESTEFIRKYTRKNDTVLFKGKEAAFVLRQLTSL